MSQVNKYTDRITSAHVVLNVEKDRHIAEVTINVSRNNINAKAIAGDMYAAIDMVMDKIVKQLKKHLEKMKDHKISSPYPVIANLRWEDAVESTQNVQNSEPEIEEIKELKIDRQNISEALRSLEVRDLNFWIFKNPKDNLINIVYKRREDGSHGLLILK